MKEHTNRLINETSPYLLQHANNPVDWQPWGIEALEQAKKEDKPIYLSIGYSTCYWCHKMESECFESEDAAKALNEYFISIKVDREERPDIDEQYMLATQLLTGRGGWPNSVWLTPHGKPFLAGSYYQRGQFIELLAKIKDVWKTRRDVIERQADEVLEKMQEVNQGTADKTGAVVGQATVDRAIEEMTLSFDEFYGGFGIAPKFPPHGNLALLIQEYRRNSDKKLLAMVTETLDTIAMGGIHDHIGGGFHRYSTDQRWFVPHFEKMLYDNAQLMQAYADAYQLTRNENYKEAVEGIFNWLQSEMTDTGGGFYSAIDAGEVNEEGAFYLWRYDEIIEALGEKDGRLFAKVYGLKKEGNYEIEKAANILYLPKSIEEYAKENTLEIRQLKSDLRVMRSKLLTVRKKRPHPHKDDKIITGHNGLMIEALAHAGGIFNEPRYRHAAIKAADFILTKMTAGNHLMHTYRAGKSKVSGYLDDYAFMAMALLELYEAGSPEKSKGFPGLSPRNPKGISEGNSRWLDSARCFADVMLQEFQDNTNGGFYYASSAEQPVLMRSKNLLGGGNLPSPNGIAALVLLRLGRILNESRYTEAANRTLEAFSGLMWQSPQSFETEILAAAISIEPVHAL